MAQKRKASEGFPTPKKALKQTALDGSGKRILQLQDPIQELTLPILIRSNIPGSSL